MISKSIIIGKTFSVFILMVWISFDSQVVAQTIHWKTDQTTEQEIKLGIKDPLIIDTLRRVSNDETVSEIDRLNYMNLCQRFLYPSDATELAALMADLMHGVGSGEYIKKLDLEEYPIQILALQRALEHFLKSISEIDWKKISIRNLSELKKLWNITYSTWTMIREIIKGVRAIAKIDQASSMATAFDIAKGPMMIVDLLRKIVSIFRNHLGVVEVDFIESFFRQQGLPIFEEDFNYFKYSRLILGIDLLKGIERLSEPTAEKLRRDLISRIQNDFIFHLIQLNGLRNAEAELAIVNTLNEGAIFKLVELQSASEIFDLSLSFIRDEKDPEFKKQLLEEINSALVAVESGKRTQFGMTTKLKSKLKNSDSSWKILKFLTHQMENDPQYSKRFGFVGNWGAKLIRAATWTLSRPSKWLSNIGLGALYIPNLAFGARRVDDSAAPQQLSSFIQNCRLSLQSLKS